MQSRRDQVQAQSYVLGRLTAALVAGDPERAENPHRRTLVGVVCGVLVAALMLAGFGIYGYLRPGGSSAWRKPGTLVLEKETGSRYVYTGDQLRPVLNYASARLLFGGDPPRVSVSSRSLTTVTRGLPVGIVAAPDALPGPGALADAGWTSCAVGGADRAGAGGSGLVLTVAGGHTGAPLGGDAVVVRPVGDRGERANYLVWQGHRHRLGAAWMARVFGYDGPAESVDSRWIDLLPPASDIDPVQVPGLGEPGPTVQGRPTRIGQLFVVRLVGAEDRYYVLLRDGFSPLTATGYAIVAADPVTARAYPDRAVTPTQVGPSALAQVPVSGRRLFPEGLPSVPPPVGVAGEGRSWCVRQRPGGPVEVVADTPAGGAAARTELAAGAVADAVRMAPGAGGLVRSGRPGQAAGGPLYLVTDAGLRYGVPSDAAAAALGYQAAEAVTIPPEWLRLLPEGPLLDPAVVRGE
ncbi:type VII secretion protein EccB [Micromonospora sp. WMMD1082]|uniref:type VII secretion protein EccB n=1 Tax=Micromonospora sp. WMMD1082 TaxID=3016104 RepID=UPI002416D2C9|nr:type VII secretion protein EccB [Micromonospora sp. WMMD1082]MDG4795729.1 type VII secretion protein EccB [Micromonospora sp. WMMD1082]